jgi:opacity protein-like surface antigen
MRSVKLLAAAGAATLLTTAAFAADMPIAPPPQYYAPPAQDFGGWYLRGDIGMTNQKYKDLTDPYAATAANYQWLDKGGFDSGALYGLGAGYQFNSWFRADVTGQYRGKTAFHAIDSFTNGGVVNTNDYTATKSEWLVLANAYVDLGTWWCVTPFIGAGVGGARVTMSNYRDTNAIANGGGWAPSASTWNLAWAAHAGLAYKVSNSFTVELAYSYVSLGTGKTGDPLNLNGTNPLVGNWKSFNDITSHDLKLGVRWNLDSPPVYAPPLIRKG